MNNDKINIGYEDISHLTVYFNANAHDPEQLLVDLQKMSDQALMLSRQNMSHLISTRQLGVAEFKRATACTARDEISAQRFFEDVYNYAFEGGEEPDLTNYWNR